MKKQIGILALVGCLGHGIVGCATNREVTNSHQEDIGLGIVLGTSGYQQIQSELTQPLTDAQSVTGQVLKIEGGAYLVQVWVGSDMRLPLDENTTIDRPAHVGDWIEAFLDESGRATHIRNIDEEIE